MASFGFIAYIWKGESASPPANPVQNWVYRDTSLKQTRLFDGGVWKTMVKDGQGISAMAITYTADIQGTVPPANGWTANIPTVPQGQFLWTKINFTLDGGSQIPSYIVARQAVDGVDGVGIANSEVSYASAASGTIPPTGGWQSGIPSVAQGSFLWARTVFTFTNNETETAYSVSYMGIDGGGGSGGGANADLSNLSEAGESHFSKLQLGSTAGTALAGNTKAEDIGGATAAQGQKADDIDEALSDNDTIEKANTALQPVSGATAGNFAGLDANRKVVDSGSKASDFATADQGTTAENALPAEDVIDPATANDSTDIGKAADAVKVKEIVGDLQDQINDVNDLIPSQANAGNKLADQEFVNSSIQNFAANYVTPTADGASLFADFDVVNAGPWFHAGESYTPTKNDYSIYANDTEGTWRVGFDGTQFNKQYQVNEQPLTASQVAALNSGITASIVGKFGNNGVKDADLANIKLGPGDVTNDDTKYTVNQFSLFTFLRSIPRKINALFDALLDKVGFFHTVADVVFNGNVAMAGDNFSSITFDINAAVDDPLPDRSTPMYDVRLSDYELYPSYALSLFMGCQKFTSNTYFIRLTDNRPIPQGSSGLQFYIYDGDNADPWMPSQDITLSDGTVWAWDLDTKTLTPDTLTDVKQTNENTFGMGNRISYKDTAEQLFGIEECLNREYANRNRIDALESAVAGFTGNTIFLQNVVWADLWVDVKVGDRINLWNRGFGSGTIQFQGIVSAKYSDRIEIYGNGNTFDLGNYGTPSTHNEIVKISLPLTDTGVQEIYAWQFINDSDEEDDYNQYIDPSANWNLRIN